MNCRTMTKTWGLVLLGGILTVLIIGPLVDSRLALFTPAHYALAQSGPEETMVLADSAAESQSFQVEGAELPDRRTLTSKTYQLGPDEYRAIISSVPMHYVDDAGIWQEIDTAIQRQNDGSYASLANLVKIRFPQNLGAQQSIQLDIPIAQPEGPVDAGVIPAPAVGAADSQIFSASWRPLRLSHNLAGAVLASAGVTETPASVSDNRLLFQQAYPGVTEEFTVVPGGVKHALILSHLPDFVASAPSPDSFLDYEVELSVLPGFSLYVDGQEQTTDFSTFSPIEIRRDEKDIVGYLQPAYAYEQNNPRQLIPSLQQIQFKADRIIITTRTPLSWLADPARVYPVVIDPTTTTSPWQDTMMAEGYPTTNYGNWQYIYAGYDPRYGYGRERMLLHWDVGPVPASSNISSATIGLYQTYTAGNTSCILAFFRMTNYWHSAYATWNNRFYNTPWNSPGAGSDYYNAGYGFSFSNTNNIWKASTASGFGTDWVRGWIDGTYPNYGVILKPLNIDSYVDCERGFRTWNSGWQYAPYLQVTYTFTGGTPTLLYHNSAQTHTYPNPEHYYQENSSGYEVFWRGTAMRPLNQSDFDLWLHTAADFSQWQVHSAYGVGRVDYTLTKEFVSTTGYPRVDRYYGSDNYNIQYLYRLAQINPPYDANWYMGSSALWGLYEIYITTPDKYQVIVTPLSGNPDLGVAVHHPSSGNYQTRGAALALSDQVGQNLVEEIVFDADVAGFYGLAVWGNVATGVTQAFELEVHPDPSGQLTNKSYLPIIFKAYVPSQGPFSNGGFENSAEWILTGDLKHERTTAQRRSGSYALLLGHDGSSPCLGQVPCSGSGEDCESYAQAAQGFDVPASGSPTVGFYYRIYTYDHKPVGDRTADHFAVYVREMSQSSPTQVYKDDLSWVTTFNCDNPVNSNNTWQYVGPIDLSAYKGKTVELSFKVTNGGHNYWNTWIYLDDVTCSGC
jgi:hypothetical protein